MLQAYVSSVSDVSEVRCKCVYADVAKVDRDVAYFVNISKTCCKCFKGMLQAFVQNISSVADVCCKPF
jgi:histone H3/H4